MWWSKKKSEKNKKELAMIRIEDYKDLKIGNLASTVLRRMLEDGMASEYEIRNMQSADYSKQIFHLNFPLLVKEEEDFPVIRYYKTPILIYGSRLYVLAMVRSGCE